MKNRLNTVFEYCSYLTNKVARNTCRNLRNVNRKLNKEIKNIAICLPQVLFTTGGAEDLVASLMIELRKRRYNVDLVKLPYAWYPKSELLKNIESWQRINLDECCNKNIDLVITTKFPSYYVQHHNKVLWLVHQYRQVYDLFGTNFSEYSSISQDDIKLKEKITLLDNEAIITHKKCFSISYNTTNRLKKYNGLDAMPLYHPPKLNGRYRCDSYGDYILSVGRLEKLKRIGLLLESLIHTEPAIKCKIAGTGPYEGELKKLVGRLGLENRVEFRGFVDEDHLLKLYSECFATYFAPFDEDYGYITLEAFLSKKPVITSTDAGGPLEFVKHGQNGFIFNPEDYKMLGSYISLLYNDKNRCMSFGESGYDLIKSISWDNVIKSIVS